MKLEVDKFLCSAISYCELVENYKFNTDKNKLNQFLISVSSLYAEVMFLPEVESENDEVSDLNFDLPDVNLEKNETYWVVFEPYTLEEPIRGSLTDDFIDIYKNIKEGVLLYQRGEQLEAIWHWKYNFEIHWGKHALNAMRAFHSINFS
ncbi:DUF5063 domain-containing protein [Metabacillus idriensis]|uniref:DUF5063 domain-containing protein n=1 Tax=Metabacillus idriensis TaxID=324768 RepID=UPI003D27FC3E